jgi:AcrR family transcriptional regulator
MRLFLLRGYKNVSLVDVAKEAGITKGGIYHYFGSKEDLLRAAIYHLLERFEAKSVELFSSKQTFQEILKAVMVERELELHMNRILNIEQGDFRTNQASLALEVMHNFPELQARLDRSNLQFCKVIEKKLQQAQQLGEIRLELEPRVLATIILAILSGQNILGKDLNTPALHLQIMDSLWRFIGA